MADREDTAPVPAEGSAIRGSRIAAHQVVAITDDHSSAEDILGRLRLQKLREAGFVIIHPRDLEAVSSEPGWVAVNTATGECVAMKQVTVLRHDFTAGDDRYPEYGLLWRIEEPTEGESA